MTTEPDWGALMVDVFGVTVTHLDESTYGHMEEVPAEFFTGDIGGVQGSVPSVAIMADALTGITPRKGINERVTVDGTLYFVRAIQPHPSDTGMLILGLSESRRG